MQLDKAKVKDALARLEKWQKEDVRAEGDEDNNSHKSQKGKHKDKDRDLTSSERVSAEDIEAFRMKRSRAEDPMAKYQDEEKE